jgi:hypothetical protein
VRTRPPGLLSALLSAVVCACLVAARLPPRSGRSTGMGGPRGVM